MSQKIIKSDPEPVRIVLRLEFEYYILSALSFQNDKRVESIGLMFKAGSDMGAIDAAIESVLAGYGAHTSNGRELKVGHGAMKEEWTEIKAADRACQAVMLHLPLSLGKSKVMSNDEEAFFECAIRTRQIGLGIASAMHPIGWRRADDVEGATSTMSAMNRLFQELEALDEAQQLGGTIRPSKPGRNASRGSAL